MNPLDALRAELKTIDEPRTTRDPLEVWNWARIDAIVDEGRRVAIVNRVIGTVQLLAVDAIAATLVWPLGHGSVAMAVLAMAGVHATAMVMAA